ncbi:MAG TPA: hypothetical protein PKD32_10750 [Saprospiraceae bacterium]|nr:hypothetical protein [Saprospiraceae bacterium]
MNTSPKTSLNAVVNPRIDPVPVRSENLPEFNRQCKGICQQDVREISHTWSLKYP